MMTDEKYFQNGDVVEITAPCFNTYFAEDTTLHPVIGIIFNRRKTSMDILMPGIISAKWPARIDAWTREITKL